LIGSFYKGITNLVEIWTDHKNLEYFMTTKLLASTLVSLLSTI